VEPLSDYVLDTVALIRHLEDDLPPTAARAFADAEGGKGRLFLPEIALGEFVYVALRGRLRTASPQAVVAEVLDLVRASDYISVSSLRPSAWDVFLQLDIPELHDRMIAADAMDRGIPLVTNDPAFKRVADLHTVWR